MKCAKLLSRGVLKVTGEDKSAFLQGLITNDIHKLEDGKALYACLLTPQGKYLFDFFIFQNGSEYLIDCEKETLSDLQRKLRLHKLRSQVEIIEEPELSVYAFWSDAPQTPEELCFQDPRMNVLGDRCLSSQNSWDTTSTEDDFIHYGYTLGIPYHSRDLISQKSILLESHMDELHAIDWDKGCYMGQELTARTKYRGLVRKCLFPVQIEGKTPSFGADIIQGDKRVGEMRGTCKDLGLGLIRTEAFEDYEKTKTPLTCEGSLLRPYAVDWMRTCDPSSSMATKSVKAPGKS